MIGTANAKLERIQEAEECPVLLAHPSSGQGLGERLLVEVLAMEQRVERVRCCSHVNVQTVEQAGEPG